MARSDGFSWFTYLTYYLHALFIFLLFCWRVDGLVFNKASHEEYRVIALSLISLVFISGTIPVLKRMEKRSQRRMLVVDEALRVKSYLKFAFGATILFSLLPRIAVFFVLHDLLAIWVYALVSLGGISIFFFIFIFPYRAWLQVFYHVCGSPTYVPLAFNFIITTALCRIGSTFPDDHHVLIVFIQVFFSWISVVASVEYAHVSTGNIYIQKPPIEDFFASLQQSLFFKSEVVTSIRAIEYDDEKFNCKICTNAYNLQTRIPLMLSCGHSLCTECASILLANTRMQYIRCPFCQEVTFVDGPVSLLPKNYTILEFLEAKPKDVDVEGQKVDEEVVKAEKAVDAEKAKEAVEAEEAVGAVDAEGAVESVDAEEAVEAVDAEETEESGKAGEESSLLQQV